MKILLIVHDPAYRAFLQAMLDRSAYRVDIASTGRTGIASALHARYDMLLLGAELPDLNAFELVQRLRQEGDITPVLMLSTLASSADKARGLYAGADDYMEWPSADSDNANSPSADLPSVDKVDVNGEFTTPGESNELLARIYALHRRRIGGLHAPTIISVANLELNVAEKVAYRASKRIRLTAREFQLLSFLVENAGRVVTKTQILEKVWDSSKDVRTNKVEVYINFLRKKIDHGFDQKLIQTTMGVGYQLSATV
ncbi:response regulator transcription factor [Spirosoma rhododendri]|uniref:Response regulator transcription factor n=1 Tax=Spirosoma rhododendri TaxID=2728024 RepID=A0A7L5DTY7_9BACT|nr:response regulator transcription factor [Spirosoma rhododendri]QJD79437.1 response regulator transcription factor [Spirosoma rhododendri]